MFCRKVNFIYLVIVSLVASLTASLPRLRGFYQQCQWRELRDELEGVDGSGEKSAEFFYLLARAYCGMGQPERSFQPFAEAIAQDPGCIVFRLEAIEALIAAAQWEAAKANLDSIGLVEAVHQPLLDWMSARCTARLGQPDVAERHLLALQSAGQLDLVRLGVGLVEVNLLQGDLAMARHCLDRLLELDPQNEDALVLKVELLRAHAVHQFDKEVLSVLEVLPSSCRLRLAVAAALSAWMYLDAATQVFADAVAAFGLTGALGRQYLEFLAKVGDLEALEACLEGPLDIFPSLDVDLFFAEALCQFGKLKEAEVVLSRVAPSASKSLVERLFFKRCGRYREAVASMRAALRQDPSSADLNFLLAQDLLGLGEWSEGWSLYSYRFFGRDRCLVVPPGVVPRNIADHPEGRHVLVFGEQGVGDSIMLASMVPDLLSSAASVTLLVQPRLEKLFANSFAGVDVVSSVPPELYERKESCYGLGCLGQFFRLAVDSYPKVPYIHPPEDDCLRWRDQLLSLGHGLKVGIAWSGGGLPQERLRRSVSLDQFEALFGIAGIHWVNLQYAPDLEEVARVEEQFGVSIHSFDSITQDLVATSALTKELDLVITVQQTALHIAGSVGTPAWVLLPMDPVWRYSYEGERMPWYGSVELFRQSKLGDWAGPIEQIRQRLQLLVQRADGHNGAHS